MYVSGSMVLLFHPGGFGSDFVQKVVRSQIRPLLAIFDKRSGRSVFVVCDQLSYLLVILSGKNKTKQKDKTTPPHLVYELFVHRHACFLSRLKQQTDVLVDFFNMLFEALFVIDVLLAPAYSLGHVIRRRLHRRHVLAPRHSPLDHVRLLRDPLQRDGQESETRDVRAGCIERCD